jgi:hypothetical protein
MPTQAAAPSWTQARARVAALARGVRAGERTSEELDEARRELALARRDLEAARIEDHVRRCLNNAAPLTTEQRNHLAELLRPARRERGNDA